MKTDHRASLPFGYHAPLPDRTGPEERSVFLADVLAGFAQAQKAIPSKYFYDERGSQLFDEICELDEYYVTRTEVGIMRKHAREMTTYLGPRCLLLEYGSGTSTKTTALLDHLPLPAAYAPVDIAREHLLAAAERVAGAYPAIDVHPVWADFTGPIPIPDTSWGPARRVVYFPGSTIGNFAPAEALTLLRAIAQVCRAGGGLLIGVDLRKPADVLEAAYDDRAGVTATFNLNVLRRIRDELGATVDLEAFRHRAFWNDAESRIEMHLASLADQVIEVGCERFSLAAGETILTEYSHKHTIPSFVALAASAGLASRAVWTDPRHWFSVHYLEVPQLND